ncbi:hypothetical protein BCD48_15495 [Pseudofrankia sp. BMG5.36]|nr:hypothetical protein BCD48_15495 [Pseudofrankia sp. BMG5.36]
MGTVDLLVAQLVDERDRQTRGLRASGVLYLRGLLMPGVAGNCWSIAEAVGLDRPAYEHAQGSAWTNYLVVGRVGIEPNAT